MAFNDNYIDVIAQRIHEIADKDPRIVGWWGSDGSPEELLRAYALLALTVGRNSSVTLEHVHDAWASVMATSRPDHQHLVPMEQVPADVQEYDQPYADAINEVARSL